MRKAIFALIFFHLTLSLASAQSVTFIAANKTVAVSQTVKIPVTVKGFNGITGVQFTLRWNPAIVQFSSTGDYGIPSQNFNLDHVGEGYLTFLAYNSGGATLADGGTLFSVTFTALGSSGTSSDIYFSDTPTARTVVINSTYLTFISDNGKVFISPAEVKVKTYLEGPYSATLHYMQTELNLPNKSPYLDSLKTLGTAVSDSIVDWVLVKLKTSAVGAVVASQSALLSKHGFICNLAGSKGIMMLVSPGSYYIIIQHRNHLSVMSASSVVLGTTSSTFDFTNGIFQFYGYDAKLLELYKFGLYAGDADGSGSIHDADGTLVWSHNNETGYLNSDVDLSGVVNATDRAIRYNNRYKTTNVP